jgi:DNA ligase (NAD+)
MFRCTREEGHLSMNMESLGSFEEETLTPVKHRRPILSPVEGHCEEEILQFSRSAGERLGEEAPIQCTVEPKIRGVAVKIVYEKGVLGRACTVGDGYQGEIITPNIKTILTVPLTLWQIGKAPPFPEYLAVHGDVYMETASFVELNRERQEKTLSLFRDPKEAAMDSLKQVNPRITARRTLNMFCYRVGEMTGPHPGTYYEQMVILQSWGFRVNRPHIRICDTTGEVLEACRSIHEKRGDFPFEIEGARVTINRLDFQTKLGSHGGGSHWVFIYRFGAMKFPLANLTNS